MKTLTIPRMPRLLAAPIALVVALSACVTKFVTTSPASPPRRDAGVEEIYVLRSIREARTTTPGWCASSKTGFEPFPSDPDRFFSFWSVRSRPIDGKVVDTKQARVAELHACFGPTPDRARQKFYAEIRIGALSFRGDGECLALMTNVPEEGLFPVRCQLVLSGLPAPYVSGLLTTNTITSSALFGGETVPAGYTQASIATIRLWKSASTY
jgi:hypothetical protein